MQLIYSDQQLISNFVNKNSLLDGKIEKIEIFDMDSSVCINIEFYMRPSSDFRKVLFKFVGCREYCFSYSDDYIFYNVERVKLFQCEEGSFYISFDPYDESDVVADNDQDFILSREVYAYSD